MIRKIFNDIDNIQNKFEAFLKDYEDNSEEVIIYGAGRGSEWTINLLNKYDIYPNKIIDRNIEIQGSIYLGLMIISMDTFIELNKKNNYKIVVASPLYEDEIIEYLNKYIDNRKIYSFECALYFSFINNIEEYKRYLIKNMNEFEKLYDNFQDEVSKVTLENVIKGRVSGELHYFKEVYDKDQYFPKELIKLSDNEIILDIGAYDGDTVKEIVKITKEKYKKIYCFEPDLICIQKIKDLIKENKLNNIEIIAKGAWDKKEKLKFISNNNIGASRVCITENKYKDGIYEIEAESVDNIINDNVTYIKMDIEGAELRALKGMERIIKRDKPKLAISVYHKEDDLIEIPKYIKYIVPEYKLYLRHHEVGGTDTVLYALV